MPRLLPAAFARCPAFLAVLAVLLSPAPAAAGIEEEASAFVDERGQALIGIMEQPHGQDRRDAFAAWLEETFDLDALALLALGSYRSSAHRKSSPPICRP